MIFEFDSNSGLFVARSKGPKKRSGGVRQSPEIGAVSPKYLSDETKIYIFITRIPRVVYIILGGFSKKIFFPLLVDIYRHPLLNFPTELSLITEEKRLIKVAVLHLQRNDLEDKGNFFVFLFPCWEGRDFQIGV